MQQDWVGLGFGLGFVALYCTVFYVIIRVSASSERRKQRKLDEAEKSMRALENAHDCGYKRGFEEGVREARKGGVYR